MGTRANICISYKDRYIATKFINMDGHLENWAGDLIAGLNAIKAKDLVKAASIMKFMSGDEFYSEDNNDWGCKVEIKDEEYFIKVNDYDKVVFTGSLEEFASEYKFL